MYILFVTKDEHEIEIYVMGFREKMPMWLEIEARLNEDN